MVIKTRVFELYRGRYKNLSELAKVMGISMSQVYRVREGKRQINQGFIVGSIKAFPGYRMDELFYFVPEASAAPHSDRRRGWRRKQAVRV